MIDLLNYTPVPGYLDQSYPNILALVLVPNKVSDLTDPLKHTLDQAYVNILTVVQVPEKVSALTDPLKHTL